MKEFLKKRMNRLLNSYRLFTEADMFVYAANAALFFAIAAFPLIILLLSLLRYFPMLSSEQLRASLLELFPAVPEISAMVSAVAAELEKESSAAVSWLSGLTALWSASTGVFAIMKGLAQLYHTGKQSWMKYRLIAVLYTIALLFLIILTLGTQLGARIMVGLLNSQLSVPGLQEAADAVIPVLKYFQIFTLAATFLMSMELYRFPFAGRQSRMRNRIPGAVFTSLGWFLAAKLYTLVISRFWRPSVIYGSLTAIVLIMLWGYTIMSILFFGAALNKTLWTEDLQGKRKSRKERKKEFETEKNGSSNA